MQMVTAPDMQMITADLAIPERVLAIGAHPDDIEFGCGATLSKWADAGCAVSLLVCTDGSKGTWDVNADSAELVVRRQREQIEAAQHLGVTGKVLFLGELDGELGSGVGLRSRVAQIIRKLQPQVLLGHDPWKRWRLHPDHRAAGFLCTDGVFAARDPHFFPEHGLPHHRPDEVLLFECEEPDHQELVRAENVEVKIRALLAHESQWENNHGISPADSTAGSEAFAERVREECRNPTHRAAGDPTGGGSAGVGEYAESFKRMTDI